MAVLVGVAVAVLVGVTVAVLVGVALGHGDAEAEGLAAAAALPDTTGLADGEAQSPRADWFIVVTGPPETVRMIARVRPNAIGMARGTAMRAARLFFPRRRDADLRPLSILSTSM